MTASQSLITGGPKGGVENFLQERLRTHIISQSDPIQPHNPGTREPINASLAQIDISLEVTSPSLERNEDILLTPFVPNKLKIINRIPKEARFVASKALTKIIMVITKTAVHKIG